MTPIKAIRAKCLECCCGQAKEVQLCPVSACSLWQYRLGHNPARKGIGNKDARIKTNSARDFSQKSEATS